MKTVKYFLTLALSLLLGLLSVADKHYTAFNLCAPILTAASSRLPLSPIFVFLGQTAGVFSPTGREILPICLIFFLLWFARRKKALSPVLFGVTAALYQSIGAWIFRHSIDEWLTGLCGAALGSCILYFIDYLKEEQDRGTWIAQLLLSVTLLALTDSIELEGIPMQITALILMQLWVTELWRTVIACAVIALVAGTAGGVAELIPTYIAAAAAVCVMQNCGRKQQSAAMMICCEITLLVTNVWREYPLWLISPIVTGIVSIMLPHRPKPAPVCAQQDLNHQYDDLVRQVDKLQETAGKRISFYPEIAKRCITLLQERGAENINVTCAKDLLGGFFMDISFDKGDSHLTPSAVLGLMERAGGLALAGRRYHDDGKQVVACFVRRPPYTVDCAALCRTKEGETVCGDSALAFRSDQSHYVLLLSDGMGSGKDAFAQSCWTVTLLQKLLRAGLRAEGAVGMVHSSLRLAQQDIRFATVDLCSIDLWNGGASFVKAGAVSTFILRGERIIEVCGISMPLGAAEQADVAAMTETLEAEDIILLFSDGAYEHKDEMLYTLQKRRDLPPKELAKHLMGVIEESNDDVTVLVAQFKKNEP